jgi:hypothetical protein
MSVPVVTYERGNSYVTEPGTGAHALVGSLYVGNTEICDTFERMDGHVHMPPGTYVRSSMFQHESKGKVLNPSLTSPRTGNLEYSSKLKAQIAKLEKQRIDTKGPTPLLDKALKDANLLLAKMKQYGEILVHHGTYPSDFEGCIGAGWILDNKTLSESDLALWYIYDLIGGGKLSASPELTFKVVGVMPDIKTLKEYAG